MGLDPPPGKGFAGMRENPKFPRLYPKNGAPSLILPWLKRGGAWSDLAHLHRGVVRARPLPYAN